MHGSMYGLKFGLTWNTELHFPMSLTGGVAVPDAALAALRAGLEGVPERGPGTGRGTESGVAAAVQPARASAAQPLLQPGQHLQGARGGGARGCGMGPVVCGEISSICAVQALFMHFG